VSTTPIQVTADLSQVLNRIDQRLDKIEQKIDNVQKDVTALQIDMAAVKTEIQGAKEDIKELKSTTRSQLWSLIVLLGGTLLGIGVKVFLFPGGNPQNTAQIFLIFFKFLASNSSNA
jgi:t-SNARE complex subunit (syntaxin)